MQFFEFFVPYAKSVCLGVSWVAGVDQPVWRERSWEGEVGKRTIHSYLLEILKMISILKSLLITKRTHAKHFISPA